MRSVSPFSFLLSLMGLVSNLSSEVFAETQVLIGRSSFDQGFQFDGMRRPVNNDLGTRARWKLVSGELDRNSAPITAVHDGAVSENEDHPAASLFLKPGPAGGRLLADLGKVTPLEQINSYSWHSGSRAPQCLTIFVAAGTETGFAAEPSGDLDPQTCGWRKLATIDTRAEGIPDGGQHAVSVRDDSGSLGPVRYVLFDIESPRPRERFAQTFFSEIDIVALDDPAPMSDASALRERVLARFASDDGRYQFVIDLTDAKDLQQWSEKELAPVILEWYPKIVELLASDEFTAPAAVSFQFKDSLGGTPAYAQNTTISLNTRWFRDQLDREAKGCVVHELVHVVQQYGRALRRSPDAKPTPSWVSEGIADYLRWFVYEPKSGGAVLNQKRAAEYKHDASYRVTANFLNWAIATHGDALLQKLNAAAREGRYSDSLWKDWTGKSIQECSDDWRESLAR